MVVLLAMMVAFVLVGLTVVASSEEINDSDR